MAYSLYKKLEILTQASPIRRQHNWKRLQECKYKHYSGNAAERQLIESHNIKTFYYIFSYIFPWFDRRFILFVLIILFYSPSLCNNVGYVAFAPLRLAWLLRILILSFDGKRASAFYIFLRRFSLAYWSFLICFFFVFVQRSCWSQLWIISIIFVRLFFRTAPSTAFRSRL